MREKQPGRSLESDQTKKPRLNDVDNMFKSLADELDAHVSSR